MIASVACSKDDAPMGERTEQTRPTSKVAVDLSIPFENLEMEEGLRGVFAYKTSEENGKIQAKLSVQDGQELKVWAMLKNTVATEPTLTFVANWKVKVDEQGRKSLEYKGDINMTVSGGTYSPTSNPDSWKLFAYVSSRVTTDIVSDPSASDKGFDPSSDKGILDVLSSPTQAIVGAYALHWLPVKVVNDYFVPSEETPSKHFEPQGNLLLIKVKNATDKTLSLVSKQFNISSNVLIFQPKSNYRTLGLDETLTWSSSQEAKASSRLVLPTSLTKNQLSPGEESKWMVIWVATRKEVLTSQSAELASVASARDFVEQTPKTVITAMPQVKGAQGGGVSVSGGGVFNNLPRGFNIKRHRTTKDFRGNGKIYQMTISLTPETNLGDGLLPASWFSALSNTAVRTDWGFFKDKASGTDDETSTTYVKPSDVEKYSSYNSFSRLPNEGAITLGALGESYRKPTIYELALLFPPLVGGTATDITGAVPAVQFKTGSAYTRIASRELISAFGGSPVAYGATYRSDGADIVYALRMQGGEGLDTPDKYLAAYRYEFSATGNTNITVRYLGPQRSATTIDDIANEAYWKAELAPDQDRFTFRTFSVSPHLAIGERGSGDDKIYYGYSALPKPEGEHSVAPIRIPYAVYADTRLTAVASSKENNSRTQVTTIPFRQR